MCSKYVGSLINMIGRIYMAINEHQNFHFKHEQDFGVKFKNYEAIGWMHDLDLLIIAHELRVPYPI